MKKAVVVACGQHHLQQVSRVLAACSIEAGAAFADARSAVDGTRLAQGEIVLCLMHVSSEEQLGQLKYLRQNFPGRPLIVLVEEDCAVDLLFAVSQVGGGPVLRFPLEAEELQVALRCLKASHSPPSPVAARRVIAVSGATGGCGATTLAVNLAYEIAAKFDLSCILVDLARGGIVNVCLDVEPKHSLADLLADMRSADVHFVEKMLIPVNDRLRIFPAPPMQHEPLTASPEDIVTAIDLIKQLADVVVLDLPLHNDVRFEAYASVNQALLVAEQTVPALRALGHARQVIEGIEGVRQTVVINRYNSRMEGFSLPQLQQLLKTTQVVTVANDYTSVAGSLNEGRPLRLNAPGSRVVGDIHNLAKMQVVPGYTSGQPPAARKGMGLKWLRNPFGERKEQTA
jgi:pilus assembly protein CpaE